MVVNAWGNLPYNGVAVDAQNLVAGDVVFLNALVMTGARFGGTWAVDDLAALPLGWVQVWAVYTWTTVGTVLLFANGTGWVGDPETETTKLAPSGTLAAP